MLICFSTNFLFFTFYIQFFYFFNTYEFWKKIALMLICSSTNFGRVPLMGQTVLTIVYTPGGLIFGESSLSLDPETICICILSSSNMMCTIFASFYIIFSFIIFIYFLYFSLLFL